MEEEVKVSELPIAANVDDDDLVMIVQNGFNKQVTKKNLFKDTDDKIEDFTIYSTNETKMGTWIDGKPIYRKVIEVTSGFDTYMFIPHGISNLENLVDIRGWHNTLGFKPLPTIYATDIPTYAASIYTISSTNIEVSLSSWISQNIAKIVIIIEYTKTTD